jgi:hypothetical protein
MGGGIALSLSKGVLAFPHQPRDERLRTQPRLWNVSWLPHDRSIGQHSAHDVLQTEFAGRLGSSLELGDARCRERVALISI